MLTEWDNWTLGRLLTLIIAFGFLMIWAQMTIWHYRGKFHRRAMWIPVILLPLLAMTSIIVAFHPVTWTGWLQTSVCVFGIIVGLIGNWLHIRAISKRTGGIRLENLMSGPPFILPLSVSVFSIVQILNLWY